MFMLTRTACLVALVWALPGQSAMTIQPDPQNSGGYVMAAVHLASAAQAKTANPMYGIWSHALATRPNSVVEAIVARAPGNPDNVKRVERVFTESDWEFLTQMAAPEYTYERFLRAVGNSPPSAATTRTGAMRTPSARSPSSPPSPTLPMRPAATLPRRMSPTTP